MSFSNVAFPYDVKYVCQNKKPPIVNYQPIGIDNYPVFKPLSNEVLLNQTPNLAIINKWLPSNRN